MTSTQQPALPHIDTARFEPAVWDSFIQRWGELEAAHLVPVSVMEPRTCFDTAHVCWVVVRINGREWVKHCESAAHVAQALFVEVHGVSHAAVATNTASSSPCTPARR